MVNLRIILKFGQFMPVGRGILQHPLLFHKFWIWVQVGNKHIYVQHRYSDIALRWSAFTCATRLYRHITPLA